MTHPILWQGWPLSLGQMDGRTIRDVGKISVNSRMSMAELKELFRQPPLSPGHLIVEHPGLINSHGLPCDTRWPIFEIASVDLGQNARRGYTANFVLGTIRSVPNKSGFEGRQLFSDEVF